MPGFRRTAPLSAILEHISALRPGQEPTENLTFTSHGHLTLGAEVELQIIDRETGGLVPRSEDILAAAGNWKNLHPEFYLSTVEIATDKCADAHEVHRDLADSLDRLDAIGEDVNVAFATTACHPFARYADCIITPTPRYSQLIDRNQWLTRRMTVYGLHIHIGMRSGDECIRFNNFFLHFLPHLVALTASSPFWQGEDTGLASCRPTTYEALPTAGQPYIVGSWAEFEQMYTTLKACRSIESVKDLWWDLRPSPGYGTLEIRVCDGLASLEETVAIVAFVHGLAHWFSEHANWLEQVPPPPRWLARENKWRAMRFGLDADLVTSLDGSLRSVRDDIRDWCRRIAPMTDELGYGAYMETIERVLMRGNSAMRQRGIMAATGSLRDVSLHNVAEFVERRPVWGNTPS